MIKTIIKKLVIKFSGDILKNITKAFTTTSEITITALLAVCIFLKGYFP